MITLSYNGYSLQTAAIITERWDGFNAPGVNVQVDKLAHADGGRIVQSFFDTKTFTIEGHIISDTAMNMQTAIDQFKAALSSQNGILTYQVDTANARAIYCTPQVISIANTTGKSVAPFSVQFVSADGVSWDATGAITNLITPSTFTTSSQLPTATILGSYKAQPDIKVTLNSVTGTAPNKINISNGSTLKGISVSRTWAAGDVLEIDCLNQLVYVNNVPVDYTGNFPTFAPGVNTLRYIDDFTTRNATMTATYTIRWL